MKQRSCPDPLLSTPTYATVVRYIADAALHEAVTGTRYMLEHRQGQVPEHHKCRLKEPHTGGRIRLWLAEGHECGRKVNNTRHAIV